LLWGLVNNNRRDFGKISEIIGKLGSNPFLAAKNIKMENIDFVLWAVLWPLMIKTDTYLTAKINQIKGNQQDTDTEEADRGVILIWIVVGLILFFN